MRFWYFTVTGLDMTTMYHNYVGPRLPSSSEGQEAVYDRLRISDYLVVIRPLNPSLGNIWTSQDLWIRILTYLQSPPLYFTKFWKMWPTCLLMILKAFLEKYGYIGQWHLWSCHILSRMWFSSFASMERCCLMKRGGGWKVGFQGDEDLSSESLSKDQVHRNQQERRIGDREWRRSMIVSTICIARVDGGIGMPANLVGVFRRNNA